jgi:hypothetical protein
VAHSVAVFTFIRALGFPLIALFAQFPVFGFAEMNVKNGFGFLIAIWTMWPTVHARRWPIYFISAVAGALTVFDRLLLNRIGPPLGNILGPWFWLPFRVVGPVLTSFLVSAILLAFYRIAVRGNDMGTP